MKGEVEQAAAELAKLSEEQPDYVEEWLNARELDIEEHIRLGETLCAATYEGIEEGEDVQVSIKASVRTAFQVGFETARRRYAEYSGGKPEASSGS